MKCYAFLGATRIGGYMSSSFFKIFFCFSLVLSLFIIIFFIPIFSSKNLPNTPIKIQNQLQELNGNFTWPAPGYTRITSPFGPRVSPTGGASSYHSGVDISAPAGSNIVAAFSGKITLTEFKGAGGYTITIVNDNFTASYCHVSPNFIVQVGQHVKQGDIIGNVGPKNVYGIIGNPYKDSKGNPTNGATTGPHLHFTLKKDGKAINPLEYL